MMIVGLIPAHNEAVGIEAAVRSVMFQVDRVIVISDNSTDDTVERARAVGATVVESISNRLKKAGALNQALDAMLDLAESPFDLPQLTDDDFVLVMDADSRISSRFVERALTELELPGVGAVGGVFRGDDGGGLIGQLQRNEYTRYARAVSRRGANAWVLTGTAAMIRVDVIRRVAAARASGQLPGRTGVYDTKSLTEDNELTLAIKTLGYSTMSPRECEVRTEVMQTVKDLWLQRLRWQRGAIDNLRAYGFNKTTRPYYFQQGAMLLGLLAMWLFLTMTCAVVVLGVFTVRPWGVCVGLIFVAERIVTVRKGGFVALIITVPMVIEFCYDFFLQVVLMRSMWDIAKHKEAKWHHSTDCSKAFALQGAITEQANETATDRNKSYPVPT